MLASKTGEPILALWRYGGGTTAAFTSDIQSRWAAPWLNWPGFGKFWVQLVRQTMRHETAEDFAAHGRAGRRPVVLHARRRGPRRPFHQRGRGQRDRQPSGDGKPSTVALMQIAPGRYAGSQAAGQGTYWLEGQVRRDGQDR